jgi:hypothetical protein
MKNFGNYFKKKMERNHSVLIAAQKGRIAGKEVDLEGRTRNRFVIE